MRCISGGETKQVGMCIKIFSVVAFKRELGVINHVLHISILNDPERGFYFINSLQFAFLNF